MKTCQMTMDFTPKAGWSTFGKCGKPAKYRVPNPQMKVEYVCGIHARSINIMNKRLGRPLCIPLEEK